MNFFPSQRLIIPIVKILDKSSIKDKKILPYEILAAYHWSFSGIRTPKNSSYKSLEPWYFLYHFNTTYRYIGNYIANWFLDILVQWILKQMIFQSLFCLLLFRNTVYQTRPNCNVHYGKVSFKLLPHKFIMCHRKR